MVFRLYYFPIIASLWVVLGIIITYIVSVCLELVPPLFPYISETGAYRPVSSIFAVVLNVGAILIGISFYIRFRQVELALKSSTVNLSPKWNKAGFWMGMLFALGVFLVANFQGDLTPEAPPFVFIVHFIGAILAFGIAFVYMIVQLKITIQIRLAYEKFPKYKIGIHLIYFRVMLIIFYLIFFIATLVGSIVAISQFKGTSERWWKKEDGGYEAHLVSTFSEWLMVFTFIVYALSMEREFRTVKFDGISFETKCIPTSISTQEMVL